MICSLDPIDNNNSHPVGEIIEENFFGEELPSPENSATYVTTYIEEEGERDLAGMIQDLGSKMLKIGDNFPKYVGSFENLRFELKPGNIFKSLYSKITGYDLQEDVILLVGERGGVREVVGALPFNNSKYPSTSLLISTIKTRIQNNEHTTINKSKLVSLIGKAYEGRMKQSNPLRLSKYEANLVTQTLGDLKTLYGKNYPFIFSSPYIVTGRFNMVEDYSGRTVILYNKFPNGSETVDSIISKYGYNKSLKDNKLGLIPLDNGTYTNLNTLLEDIAKYSVDEDATEIGRGSKMFVSSGSLTEFGDILYKKLLGVEVGTTLGANIKALLNASAIGSSDGEKSLSTSQLDPYNFIKYINSIKGTQFFSDLNTILEKSAVEGSKREKGFKGIFINPILVKRGMDFNTGLAKVQNFYPGAIDNKILIKGLSPNVVQAQRMEFKFTDTIQDMSDLFSTERVTVTENIDPSDRFNYSTKKPSHRGKEIRPTTSKLLEKFEDKGIFDPDIRQWVKNITSEVLLHSDSTNFTKSLTDILNKLTANNEDCI